MTTSIFGARARLARTRWPWIGPLRDSLDQIRLVQRGAPMQVDPQVDPNSTDTRVRNAPHARAHAAVHVCPYRHPDLRTSWLRVYAQARQQSFDF